MDCATPATITRQDSLMKAPPVQVSPIQQRQFKEQGYLILEQVIDSQTLEMLRSACAGMIARVERQMDEAGTDVIGINHRDKRYFSHSGWYRDWPGLERFLFGELMAEVCRRTIGDCAYLFNEIFVTKAAEVGMTFGWHQDSGYIPYAHAPYLTCWCALDDMSEANGTVYILPYSNAGTREQVAHVRDPQTNDLVGYHGEEKGIAVEVPAGSMAVFSSTCFHRSGANTTNRARRAYVVQYSPAIIPDEAGQGHRDLADVFLKNGEMVATCNRD